MSETAVPQSVTIAAVPGQVRQARAFVAAVLGESHPAADVAVLLASELVTNSVRHSGSAVSGGVVTVAVAVGGDGVRVEVTDRSGDGAPVLLPAASADGSEAEGRRGIRLVDTLAARWGYCRGGGFTTTWFEIQALSQPDATFRRNPVPSTRLPLRSCRPARHSFSRLTPADRRLSGPD